MTKNMILILNKYKSLTTYVCVGVFLFVLFIFSYPVYAQSTLSLSVTPTLFEMSAEPGQLWKSEVKVINSNDFDITVYAHAVNFAPQGETGQGKFIPVFEEMTEGSTLAEWIDISSIPVTVQKERSMTIPFTVQVPEEASPGGHFAAILISTQPQKVESMSVKTAQVVTSLFFVRIAGDVHEKGSIRSFSPTKSFLQSPEATFELRFENKGNVHLQPRGDIVIYNMWGKERGKIPINHQTHFGNVLPESIRKFEFSWKGEQSIADIGRYKAVASLAYGLNQKQFTTQSTYFWVIPVKSLLATFGGLLIFLFVVLWGVRMYIRHMLKLAGVPTDGFHAEVESRHVQEHEPTKGDIRISSYQSITAPVRSGYHDLKERLAHVSDFTERLKVLVRFVVAYRLFFVGLVIFGLVVALSILFFSDVTNSKNYEITISNPDAEFSLNSEEIKYNELVESKGITPLGFLEEQKYELIVTNTSGSAGVAAETAALLAQKGYGISSLNINEGRSNKKTVIVCDPALQDEALALSKLLGGALLSPRIASSSAESGNITIFVGQDQNTQQ